ncbi:MAG: RHS repeat protein, partial [Acidobacteria bacterium]|nr:RHS repeat protein [Acidobacteriota bacterium]
PVARASLTPVPIDRTPAPLPANVRTTLVFTSQPGGAISDLAMPVVYPNLAAADPGTRVELYAFNHDSVQWYVYGYGRVSADGKVIEPEIDPATGRAYGLRDFSWHFVNVAANGNPGDGVPCPPNTTGNPVDLSTGLKKEMMTDIAFGGARGGLMLTRIYTSDLAAVGVIGRFGRGVKDNFDIQLTGTFQLGGAGRVVMPEQISGRLFRYERTDADGALVFSSKQTITQLGDVVRKLSDGTFEYRYREGGKLLFTAMGRLTAQVDRNNNTVRLSYDASGNLTQVTDAVGRTIAFTYNAEGVVAEIRDPLNRVWRYGYLNTGITNGRQLVSVTDPLGNSVAYGYTLFRLTSIRDKRGNLVKQIQYDSSGRVARQDFAEGGFETYDYTLSGGVVTRAVVTDSLGRKMKKRLNASGYVIEQEDELGQASRIERDITTNLATSTTGPCGCAEVTKQYDSRGNLTAATDRLGQTMKMEYEPVFNQVTKITDKLGRVTQFGYDARGNLTSVTDALNQTAGMQFDSFGEIIAVTDPLGHTKRMEYDGQGNITAVIDELGNRSTMEYDAVGKLTAATDPLTRRQTIVYDLLNRVTSMTDAAGVVTRFSYDANGNQTKVTDALNRVWNAVYDLKNRLTATIDPLNRQWRVTYDSENQLLTTTSPSGRSMGYSYDRRGQLTTTINPLGGIARLSYDNRGNLLALTDQRGYATTYEYDELYRPVSTRDPLGRESRVSYDAVNRVTESVDRLGRRVRLSYDALDRRLSMVFADATVGYTYDADSRLTRIDDSQSGFVSWSYDAADRLLSETTPTGLVQYGYNAASQLTSMTAADRAPVNYGYDTAGRLQSLAQGSETFTYSYDVLSRLSSLQRPNGVTTSYSYDTVNRLSRMLHRNAQSVAIEDFQYSYNVDDEIASITALASASVLPQAKTAGAANAANRISQVGAASFTFDNLGQTTSKTDASGTTTYNWDARGRMTSASLPNGQSVSYGYDAVGRRASRTANGVTTSFLYDGADVVLDKASDGATVDYLNGGGLDNKLRQRASAAGGGATSPSYFLSDHLGSTTALTDATGGVMERQQYEPFGATSGSSNTRYGYTGRERDEATGLMYYRSRWYDAQQSRFITEDPIGFASGEANFYSYVGNDDQGHFVSPMRGGPVPAPYEVADAIDPYIKCLEAWLNSLPGMATWNDATNWWNSNFPNLRVGNPGELANLLRGTTDMLRLGTTGYEVYRNGEGGAGVAAGGPERREFRKAQ